VESRIADGTALAYPLRNERVRLVQHNKPNLHFAVTISVIPSAILRVGKQPMSYCTGHNSVVPFFDVFMVMDEFCPSLGIPAQLL